MKTFSLLASFILSLPVSSFANLSSVPFGGVNLQLQSSSDEKDPETLLVEVLTQTVQYLDESFSSLLEDTKVSFSHIGLSVDTYDINSRVDQNSVSFTFSGTAFFNSNPPPTTDDVLEMLASAFLGKSSQRFTSALMEAKDPFLQRLSYAVVQVNGYVIPGGVLQGDTDDNDEDTSSEGSIDIETVALIAGSIFGSLLFFVLCYCFWCVGGGDQDDAPEPETKPTISTSRTSETDDLEASSPAPSSPQSIASQDSSVFTYNPQSRISFDASTLSTNTANDTVDLASWQQKNTINSSRYAPFGHDISAIEMLNENKKDLSLIEEGDEQSATPVKSFLSREVLSKRERRQTRERSRSRDISLQSARSENSDVIEDLRNLSQQINHHRRR